MMAGDRFVLIGLARARSPWFGAVARWATSAAIPAEFVKCVSAEELRARLATGRSFSAVLLDGGLPAVDRDLIERGRESGSVVIVVDDGRTGRNWLGLGAAAVLSTAFGREELLDALATYASMVGRADVVSFDDVTLDALQLPAWHGPVATVCGAGGTGASTFAIALAQGLGADVRHGGLVVLADLCRHAEQAMLHDVRDIVPGVQELVDAHRLRQPSAEEVRSLTFHVAERQYHLLLGLRRARYWSSVRPRAFEAAFASLRRAFQVVVCDVDADFEGEEQGGSVDVEERNLMARTAATQADVVFAVSVSGMKGVFSLVRVVTDLVGLGVVPERIVPVLNDSPRHPRARAELSAALADLTRPALGDASLPTPLFPPQRKVEEALRDGVALPPPLAPIAAGAFHAVVDRMGTRPLAPFGVEPEPVAPGSLGAWSGPEGG